MAKLGGIFYLYLIILLGATVVDWEIFSEVLLRSTFPIMLSFVSRNSDLSWGLYNVFREYSVNDACASNNDKNLQFL